VQTHKRFKLSFLAVTVFGAMITYAEFTYAEGNRPFHASCEEKSARTYWTSTDLDGKLKRDSWGKKGTVSTTWEFSYARGSVIDVDGKKTPILVQHPGVIIAGHGSTNGIASGMWTYAIHIGLGKVVVTNVNGFGTPNVKLAGISASSIQLDCDFQQQ